MLNLSDIKLKIILMRKFDFKIISINCNFEIKSTKTEILVSKYLDS